MITWENYEEYMVMYIDGELGKAQEQELMSFLYEHPELQQELAAFSMTKMIPDEGDTYSRMDSLLKDEPGGGKVIAFGGWRTYRAAAGIAAAILLGVAAIWMREDDKDMQQVAVNATNGQHEQHIIKQPEGGVQAPPVTPIAKATPVDEAPVIAATSQASRPSIQRPAIGGEVKRVPSPKAEELPVAALERITIAPVDIKEPMVIKNMPETMALAVTNVPEAPIYIGEEKRSLIDKLPIDELKKKGMENFATALADGYDKVNSLKDEVYSAQVSMKVEKRKLIFSF